MQYDDEVYSSEEDQNSAPQGAYGYTGRKSGYPESHARNNNHFQEVDNLSEDEDLESEADHPEFYEDQNPFVPEIEQIITDKVSDDGGIIKNQYNLNPQKFLVKYSEQSYAHVEWLTDEQVVQNDTKSKLKLSRYNQKKQKLISQGIDPSVGKKARPRYDEDKEDELEQEDLSEAAEMPLIKPTLISTPLEKIGDLFNEAFLQIERVIGPAIIFPSLFPQKAVVIKGKWEEQCIQVASLLINYRRRNLNLGMVFGMQLDPQNEENHDYFKVVKFPIDFSTIINKLYLQMYPNPAAFWIELGLVFKNCRNYYEQDTFGNRKIANLLRHLAYHLYKIWYNKNCANLTQFQQQNFQQMPMQAQMPMQGSMQGQQNFGWQQQFQQMPQFQSAFPGGNAMGAVYQQRPMPPGTSGLNGGAPGGLPEFSQQSQNFGGNMQLPSLQTQNLPSLSANNFLPSGATGGQIPQLNTNMFPNQQNFGNQQFQMNPGMFKPLNQVGPQNVLPSIKATMFGGAQLGGTQLPSISDMSFFQRQKPAFNMQLPSIQSQFKELGAGPEITAPKDFFSQLPIHSNQYNFQGREQYGYQFRQPYMQPEEIGVVNRQRMEQGQISREFQSIIFQMPPNNGFDRSQRKKPPRINTYLQSRTYFNMNQGNYDLGWCLDEGESEENVASCPYISDEERKEFIEAAFEGRIDQLYLVKWRQLSYLDTTWEPYSMLKDKYQNLILECAMYNRAIDPYQREVSEAVYGHHHCLLRMIEKSQVKKKITDEQRELAQQQLEYNLREAQKKRVDMLMGPQQQFIQYSSKLNLLPVFKQNQALKKYQITALNWLVKNWHEDRNVVLADEMGLGKTIMTLSFFHHLYTKLNLKGPFLIIAPLTTLEHWQKIAMTWTTMNTILYYDQSGQQGREELRANEFFYQEVDENGVTKNVETVYRFNLMITTFEVFVQDLEEILMNIPFMCIAVDEAHRLKNKQAKTLKLLREHPCKRIILLTGTPVQNNISELWTLLNYIEPNKFSSQEMFMKFYGNLASFEQVKKLHKILQPHFLRRLKEEVEDSIPPLNETIIEVSLTSLQLTYYKGIYGENRSVLAKFGSNSLKMAQLSNIDMQLRKCCNHLFLLKGVEQELVRDCVTDADYQQKLMDSSGKMILLKKFVKKYQEENMKILIFSQFKYMLDIIEFFLQSNRIPFEKLTGSVRSSDRIAAIQRFNEDKNFGVFLLTTRAGGLGINLTSARVVIIFDSDWNPQNDLQAIARAHRIGQKHEVKVYRLITQKTYEEQMFERASKKLGMDQALFSKGAFNDEEKDEEQIPSLSIKGLQNLEDTNQKNIETLLKYGAYAFMDEETENQADLNIDDILAKGKKAEYSKQGYSLNKSKFDAMQHESIPSFNDEHFWDKVLPTENVSISSLEKRLKKEKKEIAKNEQHQYEFMKDLTEAVQDFFRSRNEGKTKPKDLESSEESLRTMIQKLISIKDLKALHKLKCREWINEILEPSYSLNKKEKRDKKNYIQDDMDEEIVGGEQKRQRVEGPNYEEVDEAYELEGNKQKGRGRPKKPRPQSAIDGFSYSHFDDNGSEGRKYRHDRNSSGDNVSVSKASTRNEKNGVYCSHCSKPEPPTCSISCVGICRRHFHIDCASQVEHNAKFLENNVNWVCPDCRKNVATCFFCKTKGPIQMQLKGYAQQSSLSLNSPVPASRKRLTTGQSEMTLSKFNPLSGSVPSREPYVAQLKSDSKKLEGSEKESGGVLVKDHKPVSPQSLKQISLGEQVVEQKAKQLIEEMEATEQQKSQASISEAEEDLQPVINCSLHNCFKYYHIDCLKQMQNVNTYIKAEIERFRCSQHYCVKCGQSGDAMLLNQCIRCPNALHQRCFGDHLGFKVTKKYYICSNHYAELDRSSFPRFEEKKHQSPRDSDAKRQNLINQSKPKGHITMNANVSSLSISLLPMNEDIDDHVRKKDERNVRFEERPKPEYQAKSTTNLKSILSTSNLAENGFQEPMPKTKVENPHPASSQAPWQQPTVKEGQRSSSQSLIYQQPMMHPGMYQQQFMINQQMAHQNQHQIKTPEKVPSSSSFVSMSKMMPMNFQQPQGSYGYQMQNQPQMMPQQFQQFQQHQMQQQFLMQRQMMPKTIGAFSQPPSKPQSQISVQPYLTPEPLKMNQPSTLSVSKEPKLQMNSSVNSLHLQASLSTQEKKNIFKIQKVQKQSSLSIQRPVIEKVQPKNHFQVLHNQQPKLLEQSSTPAFQAGQFQSQNNGSQLSLGQQPEPNINNPEVHPEEK